MSTHKCPHPNCDVQLPTHIFACKPHWFAIPKNLRNALNRAWHDGDTATYLNRRGECVQFLQSMVTR